MKLSGMKVDLHVHSKSSTRPSQWILQKIDCPESFTSQRKLYEIAKTRGMDLVTITDHNNINGCLEIAHLPDTFISEEITAYFPENNCKAHVLAHDITEDQHIEINYHRKNIYDLTNYLNREKIFHVLAHPLFDLNHKLTLEYFEKMLLLFTNFELNGSRDAYQNIILESILRSLTQQDMNRLADKHDMLPVGSRPWEKNLTGGSDDHSSLNIGRMYTSVSNATTKEEFFAGILNGRGKTDTLHETNGVALTLRMHIKIAKKTGKNLSVITCSPNNEFEGNKNFKPIGTFEIPEYPEIKLHYPPVLKMLEYCYENNFTHILTSTPGPMGLAALAISRILGIPIYGTYHTAFPQYAAELTGDNTMEELGWKLMGWFYNQLDIVYVPSMATGVELASKGIRQSKIHLYPRGIDINRFHPTFRNGFWTSNYQLPETRTKLIYVGRISKEKNLDVLSRAFNKLNLLRPDLQLIVVGDGPYRKEMEKELSHSNAIFTGYLDGDDLVKAYASSDLFIFPSSTDTFGNVVLEAQASGIPVIVTDSGGPQENLINGETGIIVPAHNDQAIIDAVLKICESRARMAKMKKNARNYMENRSFEAAFNKSWELYLSEAVGDAKSKPVNLEQLFKFAS